MSVISASGVGVSFGAHDVFSNLCFDIPPGVKIALVGCGNRGTAGARSAASWPVGGCGS